MPVGELETVEILRADGSSIVCVPMRSNFTRIIVTLTLNENMWLTPLGWRPIEKSIALPCDNTASGLAIEFPEKFMRDVKPEDIIAISCTELGFKGEMVWGGSQDELAEVKPETKSPEVKVPEPQTSEVPNQISKASKHVSEVPKPRLISDETSPPNHKKLLLSGIAALAVVGVIGITLIGGDKSSDLTEAEVVLENDVTTASNAADIDTPSSPSLIDQEKEAAEALAAEIAAKKEEAEQIEAKAIQNKKDEDLKAAVEKEAASKREKEKKEADSRKKAENAKAEKLKADREAADRKKAAEAKAEKDQADKRAADAAKKAEEKAAKEKAAVAKAAIIKSDPTPRDSKPSISIADIKTMQNNLNYMGYYSGEIDGVLSDDTTSSVELFKSIFELSDSVGVDRTVLQEIQKQRELHVKTAPVSAPSSIAPVSSIPDSTASITSPESVPILREADLVSETKRDLIKPVLLKRPSLIYPKRPSERRSFTDVVTVTVSYTIDKEGKPTDVAIVSNDHSGKFMEDFNKSALRMAEKQRYEPGRIGDEIVEINDFELQIVFQK